MLDLVHEEERLAHIAGMPFEKFLLLVDLENPANLYQVYSAASDRYLTLAGKGRRDRSEKVELDRLDSSLQMVLGDKGLLAFTARLLRILGGARHGLLAFQTEKPSADLLTDARLALGVVEGIANDRLKGSPIPVDGSKISTWANRAGEAAQALLDVYDAWSGPARIFYRSQTASRCVNKLVGRLAAKNSGDEPWLAAARLFDPDHASPGERVERTIMCHRLAGLWACAAIWEAAAERYQKAAGLVGESLGT
jgi:hypothetical protein